MAVPVVMPHMGESVVEGKITAWLKHPGDAVEADEPLVEIETDKINVEVPSPSAGVLLKIFADEGATVAIDQQIALVGEAGEDAPKVEKKAGAPAKPPQPQTAKQPPRPEPKKAPPAPKPELKKEPAKAPPAPEPEPEKEPAEAAPAAKPAAPPKEPAKPTPPARPAPPPKAEPHRVHVPEPPPPHVVPKEDVALDGGPVELGTFGVLASPAVRRFAREQRVDLGQIEGTGRMGRITREDVEAYVARPAAEEASAESGEAAAAEGAPAPATPRERHPEVDEELVPLSPMRKAIAEHMVRSAREAPHVTTVAEVDMTDAADLREQLKADFAAQGVKLTYMALIFNAVARALREFPDLNAQWTDKGILVKYRVNLGMAVAVEDGLVVPVIRDADRLPLLDLARAIQTLAEKTRQGKVAPGDLTGGTFTITNPGVFGAVISTPIIHQPQAAILATGRIADVPAVVEGSVGIRKHMFLSLSYDHRVVDGATAVRFLQRVREILEKADFERPRGELA